jgi:biotin carboxylase
MTPLQADLDLTTLHLRKVEARRAAQRAKIAVMRALGRNTDVEDEALRELATSLDYLKSHLANINAPVIRKAS